MAGTGGLEPPNDRVKVCCRNQLGYAPVHTIFTSYLFLSDIEFYTPSLSILEISIKSYINTPCSILQTIKYPILRRCRLNILNHILSIRTHVNNSNKEVNYEFFVILLPE